VKSFVSVLTSPIAQATLAGLLLEDGYSMKPYYAEKVAECGRRRDHLLDRLRATFDADPQLAGRVQWNRPMGGFFVVVSLPFDFGRRELLRCASEYGVIACPMSFFALGGGSRDRARLAFSNTSPGEIDEGIERFHRFVRDTFVTCSK
jgi:(S)-3,5-dihydroxyphenylglycine transaminase